MPARFIIGTLVSLLLSASGATSIAHAQDAPAYATGALLETEAQLESFARAPLRRAFYPPVVDLSDRFPRPGNQGRQGSCVGWAVGYAARSYYNADEGSGGRSLLRERIASPAYIYNAIADGCCSCGSYIGDALDLLEGAGSLSLADYRYDQNRCAPPTSAQRAAADGFRLDAWLTLRPSGSGAGQRDEDIARLNLVKQELAFGHPVIVSLRTTTTFFRGRGTWAGDGDTNCGNDPCGGHAITFTGYNDEKRRFKFINSWGTGWGSGGFGWMTYEAYLKRARAAYVMRPPVEPAPPEPLPTPTPDDFGIVLPKMSCGGVIVERVGRRFRLTGFAGEEKDIDAIREAVAGRDDITVEVEHRPWPQCETLLTLKDVLGDSRKPVLHVPKATYANGETLAFDIDMAGYQGYLHVAYIQANGEVVNLVQSSPTTLHTLAPGQNLRFGDGLEGRPRFTVGAPFGEEMVVVIASKSPLFDKKRPKVEIERDFLSALRDAIIARPDTHSPERLVTADYHVLETGGGS